MIETVLKASSVLDAWLREHLGRPYLAALGVGLVLGIIATVQQLAEDIGSDSVLKLSLFVAFQAALLVNQLAQFHDYRQERKARRAAKAAMAGRPGAAVPPAVDGPASAGALEAPALAMGTVEARQAEGEAS